MKLGIVDVGGGYRGVYAAAVLDYCLDNGIQFDLGIGVSAGSANLITYAAGQRGRLHRFYTVYGLRDEYASMGNYIRKRTYLDLDYVYGTLSNSDGECPLDYEAMQSSPMELYFVASRADDGLPVYFSKAEIPKDDYSVLKASCANPVACHPYGVGDTLYFDGALGDPVPIRKAMELGCDKLVLLLTRPKDVLRSSTRDAFLAAILKKNYPLAAKRLRGRAAQYNEDVAYAKQLEAEGRLLIVAPDDTCGVGTLCKDAFKMNRLYEKGYVDGKKISQFIN